MSVREAIAVIKADPKNPEAWVRLGDAFVAVPAPEKARKSYKTALEYAPDHKGALAGLAALDRPRQVEMPRSEPLVTVKDMLCYSAQCHNGVIARCTICQRSYCLKHSVSTICEYCAFSELPQEGDSMGETLFSRIPELLTSGLAWLDRLGGAELPRKEPLVTVSDVTCFSVGCYNEVAGECTVCQNFYCLQHSIGPICEGCSFVNLPPEKDSILIDIVTLVLRFPWLSI